MDIFKAIKSINKNAEFSYNDEDYNSIVWLNGTTPISIEDIKIKQAELKAKIEQEKQDAINKKASAKQKLIDLGLTEEEVKALIGV